MENRAKLRFPRTLFSPFSSCRTHKLISDVIHHQRRRRRRQQPPEVPFSSTSIQPLLPPASSYSPVRRPTNSSYSSICRPRCPVTSDEMVRESCILSIERWRISENRSPFFFSSPSSDVFRGGRRCPPASPVSPLREYLKLEKEKERKKKKKKRRRQRKKEKEKKDSWKSTQKTHFSSSYEDWFSSDDEREEDDETETETGTHFSSSISFHSQSSSKSVSLSSDPNSTGSTRVQNRRKPPSARWREARKKRSSEMGVVPLEEKVKGSFAVVKSSSDPYIDFRTSMVEMIMEKQIFRARELEKLLQWFLFLNSPHHHGVIVEVFAEICEALFSISVGEKSKT